MAFDDLLPLVLRAAEYLETHIVTRKEALDAALAETAEAALPAEKLPLWRAPSMYGPRQTVGGAVVSFMLRPCAFRFRVVFGARDGIHPTFTSFRRWTGHMPAVPPDAEKRLVQKFLHAHGRADVSAFGAGLGCCPQQAKRLWQTAAAEMEPVRVAGRTRYVLAEDLETLRAAEDDADTWRLLGPHDPYLDFRDRALLLEDGKRQRTVWQTVSNPGVLLRGNGSRSKPRSMRLFAAFRSAHAHSGRRRSPSRTVWGLTGRRRYGIITSRYYDKARRGLPPPLSRGRTGARNPLERGCLFHEALQ